MPRYGSADVGFLLASGMNILGDTTDLEDTDEALIEETTALGDAPQSYAAIGIDNYELKQQGFFNDAANRSNEALNNKGASKVLSFAPETNAIGARCISVPAVQAKYTRQISRAALHKAAAEYKAEGKHDEGKILHALGAETADGNTQSSSVDNSASSSTGGGGVLHVTALTLGGYTNIIVKIQHSANNSVWVDLITFTAVTAAPAGERKSVTGTVNRYLSSIWSFTGSGSNPSATFVAAFGRG